MLPKPTGLTAVYAARPNERNAVILTWTAVPGASRYIVFKNDDRQKFSDTTGYEEMFWTSVPKYNDLVDTRVMDVFYYVCAVDAVGVVGVPSDTITTINPRLERLIELVDNNIGDDFSLNIWVLTPFQKKLAIDQALHHVNSEPPGTDFTYASYPERWEHLLTYGGSAFALKRQFILEKAKEMAFNDQGVSWTPPAMSDALKLAADNWEKLFLDTTEKVKRNFRPRPIGLGSMMAIYQAPTMMKFRHLRAGRVI